MDVANDNMPIRYGPWLPTRREALVAGAKTYFTWAACKHGHMTYRSVSNGHCSACDKIRDTERNKVPARREAIKKTGRETQRRLRLNPEVRERERAYDRARRLDPTVNARERERMRERRKDPAFKIREDEYRRAHPEIQAVINHRRRARKNAAGGTHTKKDILDLLARQKNKCAFCCVKFKKRSDWHLDHIIPFAKGGSNSPENLQILCCVCNLEKHSLHPIDFAQRKGRLL